MSFKYDYFWQVTNFLRRLAPSRQTAYIYAKMPENRLQIVANGNLQQKIKEKTVEIVRTSHRFDGAPLIT